MTDTITAPDATAPAATPAPPPHARFVEGSPYLLNAKANLVPLESVRADHLLEDETVRKIMVYAQELSAQIQRFKQHTLSDVGSFMALLAQNYGVTRGGVKGNVTLQSYDGLLKVQVAVADQVAFGPQLQQAKSLVDECLVEWVSESNAALRTIVERAFDVDKEGDVSPAKMFPLLTYSIEDPRWKRAMQAIVDAIQIRGSKEYVRFYRRARATDRWEHVAIDVAAA